MNILKQLTKGLLLCSVLLQTMLLAWPPPAHLAPLNNARTPQVSEHPAFNIPSPPISQVDRLKAALKKPLRPSGPLPPAAKPKNAMVDGSFPPAMDPKFLPIQPQIKPTQLDPLASRPIPSKQTKSEQPKPSNPTRWQQLPSLTPLPITAPTKKASEPVHVAPVGTNVYEKEIKYYENIIADYEAHKHQFIGEQGANGIKDYYDVINHYKEIIDDYKNRAKVYTKPIENQPLQSAAPLVQKPEEFEVPTTPRMTDKIVDDEGNWLNWEEQPAPRDPKATNK